MTKYLFSVSTEYHLLLCLSIIDDLNFTNKNTQFDVYLIGSRSDRIPKWTYKELDSIKFFYIDVSNKYEVHRFVNRALQQEYSKFFIFYEFSVINSYLAEKLRHRTLIALAEDGTAIYQQYTVKAYGSRLRQTIKRYKQAIKLDIFHWSMPWESLKHGYSIKSNEIWLTQPELFKSKQSIRVNKINLLSNSQKINRAKQVFSSDLPETLFHGNVIFFIGRVSYSEAYLHEELLILNALLEQYPNTILWIKPHPLTPITQVSVYETLDRCQVLNSKMPAELVISQLNNALIVGVDSTALYYNNKSCKYLLLYPFLQKKGLYPAYRTIPFPNHIMVYE